jgi:phage gp46-like protein
MALDSQNDNTSWAGIDGVEQLDTPIPPTVAAQGINRLWFQGALFDDLTAPVITNVGAAEGAIGPTDNLEIQVAGADRVLITVSIDAGPEQVVFDWRENDYVGPYYSGSHSGTEPDFFVFTAASGWAGAVLLSVWAEDDAGNSTLEEFAWTAPPASVDTVPGAPTSVAATAGNGSAVVSWAAPASDGGDAITAYRVTRYPGSVQTVLGVEFSAVVSGLTNGELYAFTVAAENGIGWGPESAPVFAQPEASPLNLATGGATAARTSTGLRDLALFWDRLAGGADLGTEYNDLAQGDEILSAVLLSLFTDRRAEDSDELPEGETDRRGWWADEFSSVDGDRFGSRLWLRARSKQTPELLELVRGDCEEALAWFTEDRIAESVTVTTAYPERGVMTISVAVKRPKQDPVLYRFDYAWSDQALRRIV